MNQMEMETNLWLFLRILLKRSGFLLLAAFLGAALSVAGTFLLITPQYESTVTLYVIETQSAKDLADSFDVIVKMRESLMEVIRETQISSNHTQLRKRITVTAVKETDFFQVKVSGPDPYETELIADVIGQILPRQVAQIMEGTSVKVVGEAIAAEEPSWPSYPNNAVLGFLAGLMLAVGIIITQEFILKKE